MNNPDKPEASLFEILRQRLGDRLGDYLIPPPVFQTLRGEFLSYEPQAGLLRTRFPVLTEYLNPYGSLQGGILAAAVDNTLGPLSMLVAPPNVTRRLEMKYSQAVTPDLGYILVEGRYLGAEGQYLKFSAEVRTPSGSLIARAQAYHWVITDQP